MASDPSKDEIYRKYLDSRMAQQIRESSQELRALEMQIRTAYVNKALRAQLAEKEKARLEQQLRQQNECEQFRQMLLAEEERVRQQKAAAKGEQMKLRGVLQEQMIEKHQARKLLYEEFLNEKLIIDEIMRRLRTEQIEESQLKLLETKCLREDMERLKREQMQWKAEQERLAQEENARIKRYIEQQEAKQQQIHDDLVRKRAVLDKQQQIMCMKLDEIERKKREHDELMIDLKCKEIQDRQDVLDRVELENRIRRRIVTKMYLETQKHDNQLRKLQQDDDDRLFREEQMRLLAERDRLNLLSNERQRLKRIEHQRAVRQLIADREAQRHSEVFKIVQEHQDYLARERRRQEIFEEERQRILRSHADDLLGFLPPGLLNEAIAGGNGREET